MAALDVDFVRGQFPAFTAPGTAGWAHLENAGGSYVPRQVIDLLSTFFTETKVQPYWAFGPSARAGGAMDRAMALVPAALNATPSTVLFGPSTSQNTYVLAHAFADTLTPGDEVVVTDQDHEANIGAWRRLEATGVVIREWRVDPWTGLLDVHDLDDLVTERTRLVAVTHASNVAATIHPIRAIADRVHAVGGRLVVDGVSYAPHAAVDVAALDCDVYLCSAYKTYGPHVGLMYVRDDLLAALPNQGHFFNAATPHKRLTPAGPDHAEIAATAGIVDYYRAVHDHHLGAADDDVAMVRAVFALFTDHEQRLMTPLLDLLTARDGVHVVGDPAPNRTRRMPTVAFHSDRLAARDIYRALVGGGVACGHGHFYAHRLVTALGLDPSDGVVRLSMVHYNTTDEVARALEVLDAVL